MKKIMKNLMNVIKKNPKENIELLKNLPQLLLVVRELDDWISEVSLLEGNLSNEKINIQILVILSTFKKISLFLDIYSSEIIKTYELSKDEIKYFEDSSLELIENFADDFLKFFKLNFKEAISEKKYSDQLVRSKENNTSKAFNEIILPSD